MEPGEGLEVTGNCGRGRRRLKGAAIFRESLSSCYVNVTAISYSGVMIEGDKLGLRLSSV